VRNDAKNTRSPPTPPPARALDVAELEAKLTGEKSPFALQKRRIGGINLLCYRNGPQTLVDVFRKVRQYRDRPFVVFRERTHSYAEIEARATGISIRLANQYKVGGGTRIALALDNGPDWVAAFIAITSLGAVAVLVPEVKRLFACCKQTETTLAIVARGKNGLAIRHVKETRLISGTPLRPTRFSNKPTANVKPEDDAAIAFTSGSTGTPKAAVLTHRGIVTGLQNMMFAAALAHAKSGNRRPYQMPSALMLAPLAHVSGYSQILLAIMLAGQVVFPAGTLAKDILKTAEQNKVTSLIGITPALLREVLKKPRAKQKLATVGTVNINGIALHANLAREIEEKLPGVTVGTGYGQTETNGAICAIAGEELRDRARSCGRIVPAVEYQIRDGDGSPIDAGDSGEIWLRGAMTMRGYVGAAAPERGWLRTGDTGFVSADRHLHIIGRQDCKADSPGSHRPALLEIERAAVKQPGVADAAVLAENTSDFTVAVIAKRGTRLNGTTLAAAVATDMGLKPDSIKCVIVARIPRNRSGKVDRDALQSMLRPKLPAKRNASRSPKARLTSLLHRLQEQTKVPGIGVAACSGDAAVFAAAGTATGDLGTKLSAASRFEMSCLMKFFVSLVTLDLAAKGQIDLDGTLGSYLPEFKGDAKASRIKLRHLLSHTSGYRGLDITNAQVRWGLSWEKFTDFFRATTQSFEPGTTFNYEHSEHVILGEVLSRVTRRSARQLVKATLFDPLRVKPGRNATDKTEGAPYVANHVMAPASTSFTPVAMPPFGPFWDASLPDWTITLSDVVRIGRALIQGTFAPQVLAWLLQPAITLPRGVRSDGRAEAIPVSFGLGCAHYGDGTIGHNGSMLGQTCGLRIDIKTGMIAAAGVNAWSPFVRDTVLQAAIAPNKPASSGATAAPSRPLEFPIADLTGGISPDQLTGTYAGSYLGEVTVTREHENLRFDVGPAGSRQRSFRVKQTRGGMATIESSAPVSVIFFRNGGAPALMLGVHSYRKAG
jgi:acyl-CoA synthetase (AMP-forming)/AMP-acid ligase II